MTITVGGHAVILDRSGAAVLPSDRLVLFNRLPLAGPQRELFPEAGPEARIRGDLVRLAGEHDLSSALLLGERAPGNPEDLEAFLKDLRVASIWIGADEATLPEGAQSVGCYALNGLPIGLRLADQPSVRGGWTPGDTTRRCFLWDGARLLLPDLNSLQTDLPPGWPGRSTAYWLTAGGVVEAAFETVPASLR